MLCMSIVALFANLNTDKLSCSSYNVGQNCKSNLNVFTSDQGKVG